jgi:hypothetical protein
VGDALPEYVGEEAAQGVWTFIVVPDDPGDDGVLVEGMGEGLCKLRDIMCFGNTY